MAFQKAVRKKVYLKLAVTGPSGSGKTYSSLLLAFGLGKKVAVIDTENRSASLYANLGDYDVMEIAPPFTTEKYIQGIHDAVAGGYDVLVIDSITHAWAGEGGLLRQKELLDARGGNGYANWASITKKHEQFKDAFLQAPIHVICTMRSKEEYAQMIDERGKTTIKKMGMAPIQREGMSYEYTTVFDVDVSHHAMVSKDRTALFNDEIFKVTKDTGKRFVDWLESGAEMVPEPVVQTAPIVVSPAPVDMGIKDPVQENGSDPLINLVNGTKALAKSCEVKFSELVDAYFPGYEPKDLTQGDYTSILERKNEAFDRLNARKERLSQPKKEAKAEAKSEEATT